MSEATPKKLYCYTCIDCGRGFRGGKGSKRCTACKEDHTRVACTKNREAARIRARNTRLLHNDALRADAACADAAGLSYGVWRSRQG